MVVRTKNEIREKFSHEEYPVKIVGRHVAITEPMKAYAIEKIKKMERFGGHVFDVAIIMDVQKMIHEVDFIIDINNTRIKTVGRSENMYASIDQAISHMQSKLRRYMERLKEHHAKGLSNIEMNVNVIERIRPIDDINDQIEEETLREVETKLKPHAVVLREKKSLKILNQEEAIMKMELSEDLFMIYISEEDKKFKVIYRRTDGNYGIIEPEK